jgi:integrative and conjugative element protein (TIGR02256 family)
MPKKKGLTFTCVSGGSVFIGMNVGAVFEQFSNGDASSADGGGILLGRFIRDSDDIVVDEITTPADGDKRSKFFFWRRREPHQKRVDDAWGKSNGTSNYLGEWHTHPEDTPAPSEHDIQNWKRIANLARYEQDRLLFVIVGYKKIRLWVLKKAEGTLTELEQV